MSETVEGLVASIDFLGISTTLLESSGSVTTINESPASLTTRPVTTWPESVEMMVARYWSETTRLGSTIASTRSLTPNRPAAWVRSGPVAPPSPPNRWQTTHRAAANARCPPRNSDRP